MLVARARDLILLASHRRVIAGGVRVAVLRVERVDHGPHAVRNDVAELRFEKVLALRRQALRGRVWLWRG